MDLLVCFDHFYNDEGNLYSKHKESTSNRNTEQVNVEILEKLNNFHYPEDSEINNDNDEISKNKFDVKISSEINIEGSDSVSPQNNFMKENVEINDNFEPLLKCIDNNFDNYEPDLTLHETIPYDNNNIENECSISIKV